MSTLIGCQRPDFSVPAVMPNGEIKSFQLSSIKDKYVILFFYPLDFTFVCPSELIALDHRLKEFESREVEIIGISIDSQFTHHAWRNTPVEKGGIGPVRYVLASDVKHEVCRAYGVEHPEAGVALRAAFVIDKKGVIRAQMVNDLPVGRNMGELLRLVDALQFHEQHGDVCPANWQKGDQGMEASPVGVSRYLSDNHEDL